MLLTAHTPPSETSSEGDRAYASWRATLAVSPWLICEHELRTNILYLDYCKLTTCPLTFTEMRPQSTFLTGFLDDQADSNGEGVETTTTGYSVVILRLCQGFWRQVSSRLRLLTELWELHIRVLFDFFLHITWFISFWGVHKFKVFFLNDDRGYFIIFSFCDPWWNTP